MENTQTEIQNTIPKIIANLNKLMKQLNEGKFIDQDFYENYEFEILHFSIALASLLNSTTFEKINLMQEMAIRQDGYRKEKEEKNEKFTIADSERATDFHFLDKNTAQKKRESLDENYKNTLNAYRRYGEVIKSRLISEMSDLKRIETIQKSQNNGLI